MQTPDTVRMPGTVADLVAYWRAARAQDVLPHRRAIDPVVLRRWIGDLSIMEVHEGARRFFVKLHGTNVAIQIGQAFDGCYLEDVVPPSAQRLSLKPYQTSVETRLPTYSIVRPGVLTGEFKQLERLVMPFRDDDTDRVRSFLVWVGPSEIEPVQRCSVYGNRPPSLLARLRARARDEMELVVIGDATMIESEGAP